MFVMTSFSMYLSAGCLLQAPCLCLVIHQWTGVELLGERSLSWHLRGPLGGDRPWDLLNLASR